MRLRTMALVAGALGIVVLIVGLVAQAQRPEDTVDAVAEVETAVVVVPADMVAFALASDGRFAVEGTGELRAFTARPVDLAAWLEDKESTFVTGLPTWEELTTDVAAPAPEPEPSVSASPSAEPAAEPSASAEPESEGEEYEQLLDTSDDLWRHDWTGHDRISVGASQISAGLDVVVVSADGSPLTSVEMRMARDINDAWVMPLIVWGAILTAIGLVAVLLLLVDVRPLQARGEEWLAHRQRIGAGDGGVKPGSRRARRMDGAVVPAVDLPDEPDAVADPAAEGPEVVEPGDGGDTPREGFDVSEDAQAPEAEPDAAATDEGADEGETVNPYEPRPEDEEGRA